MNLVQLCPVFLVFLWIPPAWCHVEPPTNVSLHCGNLQNTLKWSYGRRLPGLRFKVDVHPYNSPHAVLWVDPPAVRADLSSFSDPDDLYLVYVTAVIGQNESVSSEEIVYSYFMESIGSQKCSVDLPAVNVTAQPDNNVMFHFMHPGLSQHLKKLDQRHSKLRKKKSHSSEQLPVFKYSVQIVGQKHLHHFSCAESVCERKLPVEAEQEKHCLNITGELSKMAVKATQLYCSTPMPKTPPDHNNFLIISITIGMLTVCVLAFVVVLVYKKMTSPKTVTPSVMSVSRFRVDTATTAPDEISALRVEPSSPTPLLSDVEEPVLTPAAPSADSPVLRLRAGVTSAEDAPDEAEQQFYESAYEKRQVFVDMGSDELVEAYRS